MNDAAGLNNYLSEEVPESGDQKKEKKKYVQKGRKTGEETSLSENGASLLAINRSSSSKDIIKQKSLKSQCSVEEADILSNGSVDGGSGIKANQKEPLSPKKNKEPLSPKKNKGKREQDAFQLDDEKKKKLSILLDPCGHGLINDDQDDKKARKDYKDQRKIQEEATGDTKSQQTGQKGKAKKTENVERDGTTDSDGLIKEKQGYPSVMASRADSRSPLKKQRSKQKLTANPWAGKGIDLSVRGGEPDGSLAAAMAEKSHDDSNQRGRRPQNETETTLDRNSMSSTTDESRNPPKRRSRSKGPSRALTDGKSVSSKKLETQTTTALNTETEIKNGTKPALMKRNSETDIIKPALMKRQRSKGKLLNEHELCLSDSVPPLREEKIGDTENLPPVNADTSVGVETAKNAATKSGMVKGQKVRRSSLGANAALRSMTVSARITDASVGEEITLESTSGHSDIGNEPSRETLAKPGTVKRQRSKRKILAKDIDPELQTNEENNVSGIPGQLRRQRSQLSEGKKECNVTETDAPSIDELDPKRVQAKTNKIKRKLTKDTSGTTARAKSPLRTKFSLRTKSPSRTMSPLRTKSPSRTKSPMRTKSPTRSKSPSRGKSPTRQKSPMRGKLPFLSNNKGLAAREPVGRQETMIADTDKENKTQFYDEKNKRKGKSSDSSQRQEAIIPVINSVEESNSAKLGMAPVLQDTGTERVQEMENLTKTQLRSSKTMRKNKETELRAPQVPSRSTGEISSRDTFRENVVRESHSDSKPGANQITLFAAIPQPYREPDHVPPKRKAGVNKLDSSSRGMVEAVERKNGQTTQREADCKFDSDNLVTPSNNTVDPGLAESSIIKAKQRESKKDIVGETKRKAATNLPFDERQSEKKELAASGDKEELREPIVVSLDQKDEVALRDVPDSKKQSKKQKNRSKEKPKLLVTDSQFDEDDMAKRMQAWKLAKQRLREERALATSVSAAADVEVTTTFVANSEDSSHGDDDKTICMTNKSRRDESSMNQNDLAYSSSLSDVPEEQGNISELNIPVEIVVDGGDSEGDKTDGIKVKTSKTKGWKRHRPLVLDNLDDYIIRETQRSPYGGRMDAAEPPTGFFHVKRVGKRWVMVDPEGKLFFSVGVNTVSPRNEEGYYEKGFSAEYSSTTDWVNNTHKYLFAQLGFNTLGCWSDPQVFEHARKHAPYCPHWNFMSTYCRNRPHGRVRVSDGLLPLFDEEFEQFCEEHAKMLTERSKDPWLLGHFSDNDLLFRETDIIQRYLALPSSDPGHQEASQWLSERKKTEKEISKQDNADFCAFAVSRYFQIVGTAVRKYDPNHLFFGTRFNGVMPKQDYVFEACSEWVDVVSVNYCQSSTPEQDRLNSISELSGHPVMITEWHVQAEDAATCNIGPSGGLIVPTQRNRGTLYEDFVIRLLRNHNVVGWHWSRYIDGETNNMGILDVNFKPYGQLANSMHKMNTKVYSLSDYLLEDSSSRLVDEYETQDCDGNSLEK